MEEAVFGKEQQGHEEGTGRDDTHGSPELIKILSSLAKELQKLNSSKVSEPVPQSVDAGDYAVVSPTASHASGRYGLGSLLDGPRKRRRLDSCGNPNVDLSQPLKEDLIDITTSLPPADILEETINVYFEAIQPWVPILHETQFRRRIHDPEELPSLVVVLHAMVTAALRFVDTPTSLSASEVQRLAKQSRNAVTLTAMENLTVENLQALVILAFNDVRKLDLQ